jgi:hypothetical protein
MRLLFHLLFHPRPLLLLPWHPSRQQQVSLQEHHQEVKGLKQLVHQQQALITALQQDLHELKATVGQQQQPVSSVIIIIGGCPFGSIRNGPVCCCCGAVGADLLMQLFGVASTVRIRTL